MKAKMQQKNTGTARFAACADGRRLLTISFGAAGRVPASKSVSTVRLSAGDFPCGQAPSGSRNKMNLTRCEIFRGKVPPRQTQKQTALEPRTQLRQTYE
jgi:hypothetical protein